MNGSTSIRTVLALCVLAASLALPMSGQARDRHGSPGSYGGHSGYSDRHAYSGRHRGYAPRGYGYYAPRCPTPYYRPYTRIYYEPRYYEPRYYAPSYYGGSGWDIDLSYHFSDRW
ncbi:MAG: hypothetical protein HZB57_09225 [Gammaproteobacteria bacterium]|nr:hypothetical protein [Gammaproteobacteria bacterium]